MPSPHRRSDIINRLPAILTALTGVVLSVMLFFVLQRLQHDEYLVSSQQLADQRASALATEIASLQEAMAGLVGLQAASTRVDQDEFQIFSSFAFKQHQHIKALMWVPRLPQVQRLAFEARARNEGHRDYQVTELDRSNSSQPAGQRQEYFPVEQTAASDGSYPMLGLDLYSIPEIRPLISKSIDSGRYVVSGELSRDGKDQVATVLLLLPMYQYGAAANTVEERRQNIVGLVAATIDVNQLVESALQKYASTAGGLDIYVFDQSAVDGQQRIYFHASRARKQAIAPKPEHSLLTGTYIESKIRFADRNWKLVFKPVPGTAISEALWIPWVGMIIGLLLTVLMSDYVKKLAVGRHQQQKLAAQRGTQLDDSVERINAVLENVVDGIITIDDHGTVVDVNPAVERIFGYADSEMLDQNVKMLMPDPYHSEHDGYLKNFIRSGQAKIIGIGRQVEGRRKDGSVFPMELAVGKMRVQGRLMFTGVVRDISERVRAEQALRASEEHVGLVLESAADGIYGLDTQGNTTFINPAAARMLGYTVAELIDQPIHSLIHHSYADGSPYPREKCPMYAAFKDGELHHITDEVLWRKDGSSFPVEYTSTPISKEDQVIGAVVTFRDITVRNEIDRMKREFISTVSHELRTPLTSIRGALGLVVSGSIAEIPEQAMSLLTIANNNSERLVRLINDILDIEKIESGKMSFDIKPHELKNLIEQAMQATASYGHQYQVQFILKQSLDNIRVAVDADRFIQVMVNLLSNAAKFSNNGESVDIAVVRHQDNIRISVTDYGRGIPEQFLSTIFQKFAQADSSDSRQKGGSGLGLSISRAIVENLGGQISFNTEEGSGTTFYIDLPEHVATSSASSVPVITETTGAEILICEDDADIARLIQMLLDKGGHTSEIAHDAEQAKIMLAMHDYKAMTVDIMLPGQDGISLIQELRASSSYQNLSIVVVSAKVDEGRQQINGGAFNVLDWISKPMDEKRLLGTINKAVRNGTKAKILHVEDDADVAKVVASLIGDNAVVFHVDNIAAAREALATNKAINLVLLDIGLPDGSGLDLLPDINRLNPPVPVVVFSAYELDPDVASQFDAALVKSHTSSEKLIGSIVSALETKGSVRVG